jgi:hypothetical protein
VLPTAARSLASPLAPRPDRRSLARLSRRVPTATVRSRRRPVRTVPPTPTSMLVVPPDATVYAIVPRRRPCVGEPCHAFPDHLPCAGEGTTVRQACRAAAARCDGRPSWATPWAAHALCTWAEPTPRAWAKCTVHLGRAWFRPSGSHFKFLFSEYIQFLVNSKICVGFI